MILSVHGINKSFDGKDILRDASFHVEKNEKVAIVGINGAGKTTLLKLIIGLEQSNVSTVDEMVQMIATQRNYDTNQRMITTIDDTLDIAVNQL